MHRAMNSKLAGLGVVALALAAGAAQAEVSSTVTALTDYDFRGITQTGLGPDFQASLDWSGESGLYAYLWGSNIDFGDCCDENYEIDYYAGCYRLHRKFAPVPMDLASTDSVLTWT